MYRNMNDWAEIRRRVLVEGVSRRQILREIGMHRQTLKKISAHREPPGYRQQQPRPRKKLGAFLERIKQILKDDQARPLEAAGHRLANNPAAGTSGETS